MKDKEQKAIEIKKIKGEMPIEKICSDCPIEFSNYIRHCRELKFEDKPNYDYLIKQFKDLFIKNNFDKNALFDYFTDAWVRQYNKLGLIHTIKLVLCKIFPEEAASLHQSILTSPGVFSHHILSIYVLTSPVQAQKEGPA